MEIDKIHWLTFNFFVRRIIAPAFIVGGSIIFIVSFPIILPGGTVLVDGQPSSDLVFRCFAVFFPLIVVLLGILIYRTKPYFPNSVGRKKTDERKNKDGK